MSSDHVRWVMHQFFNGAYLFRHAMPGNQVDCWALHNSNGRPVEAKPMDPCLIARLLTAGWIERFNDNMVATQKGLCALACGKSLPMNEEPVHLRTGSCIIIQVNSPRR